MSDRSTSCCHLPENAPFHSYEDVIHHLDSLGLFHMDMGLGRMERALSALELNSLHCPVVQIVGTNGKGSTSTFLQSIAMAHGLHVGLYTSPHFVYPEERIKLDHTMLPRRVWPAFAGEAVCVEKDLTYFELLTVLAASAFERSDCQLMIFEAGLGGRYDATTALPADMVCFVPMGLDHTGVLGDTIAAIADDKSDALRPGMSMAVSAPQPRDAQRIIERKASERGIPLCATPSRYGCDGTDEGLALWNTLPADLRQLAVLPEDAKLGLHGPYQRINAQTALLAWVLLCHKYGWKTDAAAIARGLERAFIPGRLQYAEAQGERPALWLDGAHNTHGMEALLEAIADRDAMPADRRPGAIVFSCLGDKEPEKLAAMLARASELLDDAPIFVPPIADNPRAAVPAELAALLRDAGPRVAATPSADISEALTAAQFVAGSKPILVCGSLYMLGEVFALWPELLVPQK